MTKKQDYVAIGVDAASKKLNACVLPKNEHQIFGNNRKGHKEPAQWAKKNHADIVLCENTGGYETAMLLALFNAGVSVRAYNPKQVKRYIESLGNVAKTDKTDAKRIAMLALERQPEPLQTMSAESVAFKELLAFYRQRVPERSRLKNQLKQATEPFVIKQTKSMIEYLGKKIAKIKQELRKFIADNAEWKASDRRVEETIQNGNGHGHAQNGENRSRSDKKRREMGSSNEHIIHSPHLKESQLLSTKGCLPLKGCPQQKRKTIPAVSEYLNHWLSLSWECPFRTLDCLMNIGA